MRINSVKFNNMTCLPKIKYKLRLSLEKQHIWNNEDDDHMALWPYDSTNGHSEYAILWPDYPPTVGK